MPAPSVFISYYRDDRPKAEAVCRALEEQGIACWIAPRNIMPGASYGQSIIEALNQAKVVVFVWSRRTELSGWVQDELERAKSKRVPIIPLRIDEVSPTPDIELFVSRVQWLDAFVPPLEQHFPLLIESVRAYTAGLEVAREGAAVGLDPYLAIRMRAHSAYLGQPKVNPAERNGRVERIEDLRARLVLQSGEEAKLDKPEPIRVQGTLFPCALLSGGWWEKRKAERKQEFDWKNGLQEWLFHGFDLWGPSWDITGDFSAAVKKPEQRYFIAQLGDGDEANSIPVLIPPSKASALQDALARKNWSGMEAEVSCLLGQRDHFAEHIDANALEVFGGLLDYCLWIDENDKSHYIDPLSRKTQLYSGYLWKCMAPKSALLGTPCIDDVYFIWEHVNFANGDALAYALDAMHFKEERVSAKCGEDLVLVHKSSNLVDGVPAFSADTIYRMLVGKHGGRI